jgi:hypothetical protein
MESFYIFIDNFNIDYADVWMRLFVQSLEGKVRKVFRGLPTASIANIEALDEIFIKQWEYNRDYLYYITEFGALKRNKTGLYSFKGGSKNSRIQI